MTSQGMEPTTVNGSHRPMDVTCDKILIPDWLIVIIALVGLAGNAVVISLLGCCMRRNATSVYILNLAVSDFLLLCCHFIGSLLIITSFSHAYIYIPHILANMAVIPYITSLCILSAISIERCLCVFQPIWYRCHRPRHMSAAVCTLLWILSLLLSVLDWYYSGFLHAFPTIVSWKNVDFIITAWLMFLFLTLSGSSLALAVRVLCSSQRMPLTRLYVTILLTILVFLICGLPFGIYWFLLCWTPMALEKFYCHFYSATVVLCCINSCANPLVYFFIGSFRQRHKTLKLVLQRALQDSPLERKGGDRCTQETLCCTTLPWTRNSYLNCMNM
ncbi:mas-related G-protein coupled receptor member X1 [Octodon degus]|uniref:Mas-related G-protein coupled receptor member X1 n=1 Tax=Octodon degus TaxID=10160 RepID=A0A6P3FAX7_OCTDE|nr:mas-related G-protein coupled receptor member X1 [Octodon degus]